MGALRYAARRLNAPLITDLRPLALGELIDRGARFWRVHWKALFSLYLPFQLALYSLMKLYMLTVMRWWPHALGGKRALELTRSDPFAVLGDMARAYSLAAPTLFAYWLVASLAALASSRFIASRFLGEAVTVRESVSRMRERGGALVLATLAMGLWGSAVGLAASVPGVGLMVAGALASSATKAAILLIILGGFCILFGWLGALLWWVLRFLLVSQVLAMEPVPVRQALRRAGELVSGRVGPGFLGRVVIRATVLVTATVVLLFTAQFLTSIPQLILQLIYANPFDPEHADYAAIPQVLLVPAELLQVLAQALFTPLYAAIFAAFYVDQRVRQEGLDLRLKLAAIVKGSAA